MGMTLLFARFVVCWFAAGIKLSEAFVLFGNLFERAWEALSPFGDGPQ